MNALALLRGIAPVLTGASALDARHREGVFVRDRRPDGTVTSTRQGRAPVEDGVVAGESK